MNTVSLILAGFGILGILFGLNCYRELWKWAKQCKRAHIVIAYNRRVQLNASLTEWLTWVNQLDKTENGRVVYRNQKMSVSILKRGTEAKTTAKITPERKAA